MFQISHPKDQSKSVHQAVVSEELWCLVNFIPYTAPGHLQDQILYFSHTFTTLFTIDSYVLNKIICGRIAPWFMFSTLIFVDWIGTNYIFGKMAESSKEKCNYWRLQIRRWRLRLFCLHTQSLSHDGARARGGNLIMTSIWSPLPATLLVSHSVNLI